MFDSYAGSQLIWLCVFVSFSQAKYRKRIKVNKDMLENHKNLLFQFVLIEGKNAKSERTSYNWKAKLRLRFCLNLCVDSIFPFDTPRATYFASNNWRTSCER